MTSFQFLAQTKWRTSKLKVLVFLFQWILTLKSEREEEQDHKYSMVNIHVRIIGKMIAKPSQVIFETWQLPMERDRGCKSERLLFETIRLHALPCILHCVTTALLLVGESLTHCTSTASFTVLCFPLVIFMLLLPHLLFAKLQQQMSVLLSFMADSERATNFVAL